MVALLDLVAVAAVVGALVMLLRRGRHGACAGCAPARTGAETVVPLAQLRASARRISRRD